MEFGIKIPIGALAIKDEGNGFGKVKHFSNKAVFWVFSAIQWYNETTKIKN